MRLGRGEFHCSQTSCPEIGGYIFTAKRKAVYKGERKGSGITHLERDMVRIWWWADRLSWTAYGCEQY